MKRWGTFALLLTTSGCASRCNTDTPSPTEDSAQPSDEDSANPSVTWDPWESGDLTISFLPEGQSNHLMNGPIAIDQARDLVYSTAFMTPSLAQIDANTGELLQLLNLGEDYLHLNPKPAVDGNGIVWFTGDTADALVRIDPTTGAVTFPTVPVTSGRAIAPRAGGGVLLAGFSNKGSLLMLIDSEGAMESFVEPLDPILDIIALRDGENFGILSLNESGEVSDIFRLNGTTLEPMEEACTLEFRAASIAETPDGVLAAISSSDITIPGCETGMDTESAEFGFLGTEAVATPAGDVIALDRRGLEDEDGLLVGRGYRYSFPSLTLEEIITTGHNAGYGRIHEDTNILWINGEDQGEAVGIDVSTGQPVHVVDVATHIEYAVADPDDPAVLYLTGRLSYLAGRVDLRDGSLTLSTGEPSRWPIAPGVVDRELWYYEQTRNELRGLSLDTLAHYDAIDLGRSDNELHTFGGFSWHPERDSFFAANSKNHEVIEVDRASGEIRGQWALAGQEIHPTDHGIVEVRVHDGLVYAIQSLSSVVTLIDPDQSTHILEAKLSDQEVDGLTQKTTYQISFIAQHSGMLYVSGHAFALSTLERREDLDLNVDAVVGELATGHLVGWRPYQDEAVLFDTDRSELASIPLDQGAYGKPLFLVDDHWGGRLITSNMGKAELYVISLQDLITAP